MLSVNGYEIKAKFFPDGTLNMTDLGGQVFSYLSNMPAKTVFTSEMSRIYQVIWEFENIYEQVMLHNIVRHLQDKCYAADIRLLLPYVPNARMDRTKNQFTEVHALKYFAEFINSLHFSSISVIDPHSDALVGMIDHCTVLPINDYVNKAISDFQPDFMFLPDKGSLSRYNDIVVRTPFYGEKDRDWKTGKIRGLTVHNPYKIPTENYQGKRILIVDDICSRGGTFTHSAAALKEMGFGDIALYVTHCEETIHAGEILKEDSNITHVYTTNTLYHGAPHEKMTIIPYRY